VGSGEESAQKGDKKEAVGMIANGFYFLWKIFFTF